MNAPKLKAQMIVKMIANNSIVIPFSVVWYHESPAFSEAPWSLDCLAVVYTDIDVPSVFMLYIERPKTAWKLVIALALAVAKWTL